MWIAHIWFFWIRFASISIYVLCLFFEYVVTVSYPINFAINFVGRNRWKSAFFSCSIEFVFSGNVNFLFKSTEFICVLKYFWPSNFWSAFIKGYQITRFLCGGYKWVIVLWIARRAKIGVFFEEFHIEIKCCIIYGCDVEKEKIEKSHDINQIVIEKQRVSSSTYWFWCPQSINSFRRWFPDNIYYVCVMCMK